ncbi:MAG: hypothetical protein QW327_02735 [Candidatus Odinarchaeota archaeon]
MSEAELVYEDKMRVPSWHRSLPLLITGFLLMIVIYLLMPFPYETVYNPVYNLLFSVSIGGVIVTLGVYFHIKYSNMRYAVTGRNIIIEYGLDKKIIPLEQLTEIKKISEITARRKLKITAGSPEKIIVAIVRDRDLLEIYQKNMLSAIITPADNDEFIRACGV